MVFQDRSQQEQSVQVQHNYLRSGQVINDISTGP